MTAAAIRAPATVSNNFSEQRSVKNKRRRSRLVGQEFAIVKRKMIFMLRFNHYLHLFFAVHVCESRKARPNDYRTHFCWTSKKLFSLVKCQGMCTLNYLQIRCLKECIQWENCTKLCTARKMLLLSGKQN